MKTTTSGGSETFVRPWNHHHNHPRGHGLDYHGGGFGGFQKWWYPTTMGFPTKNDHFVVFWGYPYFWKHPFDAWGFGGSWEYHFFMGENAPKPQRTVGKVALRWLLWLDVFCFWCLENRYEHVEFSWSTCFKCVFVADELGILVMMNDWWINIGISC